ncbi:pyruvate, phosphate dikinase [bacterium]|nr:pyruvate, phosphate dikinase [bacterium]
MPKKYVFRFDSGGADGSAKMKELLGGKGANLAEMSNLGIPVPAGFTISTDVCTYYYEHKRSHPKELASQVEKALASVEKIMGRKFGSPERPLLVSVRSGARASMPGMMDTVLNLGINDTIVEGFARESERAAWDCYRRFVQMYGDVVLGLRPENKDEADPFEAIIERVKRDRRIKLDLELDVRDLQRLVDEFKTAIKKRTGRRFPDKPWDQLWGAIGAVFGSWNNERANVYRRLNRIPDWWGTAVNVQAMVFGNLGDDCATGVGFSRSPATGEKALYGEYLRNAQGEDVVAGIRTPQPIVALKTELPDAYRELDAIVRRLEAHYRDMQDIEFTIERGKLWMLQTRNGKRTGFAHCRIAVDLVKEKMASPREALTRLIPDAGALEQLLRPVFRPDSLAAAKKAGRHIAKGLAAGPGAASGRVVFHAEDAVAAHRRGEKVILVRLETSPEDIRGMEVAAGILTARGGQTSHAALVARQMGKVCVSGCADLDVSYVARELRSNSHRVAEGDFISLDGFSGDVYEGAIDVMRSEVEQALFGKGKEAERAKKSTTFLAYSRLMSWSDKFRRLRVRANADQPDQSEEAVVYGAQGIGLCRTEHMFFGGDRIDAVREMILANDADGRKHALDKLLPYQRRDFIGILRAMGRRPVTIRLLDPPLHEFLPHGEKDIADLARKLKRPAQELRAKVESLHEFNPMLGHRGCRLGVVYPEIYLMQARAIVEAAIDVKSRYGIECRPEIMIPLVGHFKELQFLRGRIEEEIKHVLKRRKARGRFPIGTMIELPRAAVTAHRIAEFADFFSFGTNDLTQTAFGLSRDDAGRFLPNYVDSGILPEDPFVSLDVDGVGELVRLGIERGRASNPKLHVGICGEHGGDPASVHFCHDAKMDYVSCSPPRIPIARLAAAQAAIEEEKAADSTAKVGELASPPARAKKAKVAKKTDARVTANRTTASAAKSGQSKRAKGRSAAARKR